MLCCHVYGMLLKTTCIISSVHDSHPSAYDPLLQGSALQIQGPRGYKGSKGDLVRALKLVFTFFFF